VVALFISRRYLQQHNVDRMFARTDLGRKL